MKKSKSLSIIMAITLAAQGGGAPAVCAMKGKIQDHFLHTLFFRPELIGTLKPFLSKNIGSIPEIYSNSKFLKSLTDNGFTISNELEIREEEEDEEEEDEEKSIKKIIEKDDLGLLQKEMDKSIENTVTENFFEEEVEIPVLHYCVMKKAIKCFKFLLLNGADPSKTLKTCGYNIHRNSDPYGSWDCMSIAICFGEWEMMKILEERGINKSINPSVWEAAALTHRNNLLKLFISNKGEIDNSIFEECINKAMLGAEKGNNLKGLTILLSSGADINAKDNDGKTPLHIAAQKNSLQVAGQLIIKGAEINAKGKGGGTPLHIAAENGQKQVAELLISSGADINAKDSYGQTPLHIAALRGSLQVAEQLISKGADINAKDSYGQTPLHIAADKNSLEVAKLLISKGADINAKDNHRKTPLHHAKERLNEEVADLLIDKGADIYAEDDEGYTPSQLADLWI